MNKTDARAWIQLFGDLEDTQRCTCEKGHAECSISEGAECLDDVLAAAIIHVDEDQTKAQDVGC
jgi:hypothetical protein